MIKNILANFVGKFWSLFAVYAFTPIYIHLLGIENFGLISFYTVILSFVGLMDAGLSATLSREFAKSSSENTTQDKLTTLKTLETVYFFTVSIVIFSFIFCSSTIATYWLKIQSINIQKAEWCIRYMGLMAAAQILINFYSGGLIGLEKQVKANSIQVVFGILRSAGVILILWLCGRDVEYFFLWQLAVSILFIFVFRFYLVSTLSGKYFLSPNIAFSQDKLKTIGAFAGGMFLISVVASINTQLDKLVISKVMNMEELGYYTLSTTLSQGILALGAPFSTALLPRFTNLYSINKAISAEQLFHFFLKLVSCLLAPLSILLILFALPILELWVNNPIIVSKCINIIPFTVMGAFLLSIAVPSYCVVLANGYTRLNNIIGISSIFFTIPAYYWGITHFGAIAAAICWFFTQSIITIIFNYYVNKKYFTGEAMWRWFMKDVGLPFSISLILVLPFYFLYHFSTPNKYIALCFIVLSLVVSFLGTLSITFKIRSLSDIRTNLIDKINSH